jgi:multiple sugar transport system permease protein
MAIARPLTQGRDQKTGMTHLAHIEERWGYFFVSPWALGFLAFTIVPMVLSLYYSFTRYEFPLSPRWIGLQNYVDAFAKDELFYRALGNTAYYVLFSVPLGLAGSLFLALLLDRSIPFRALWRAMYYVPSIVPVVVSALLFGYLFQPDYGLVNSLLRELGIRGPGWFGAIAWVKPTLILLSLWGAGGPMTLIFLAGLQAIPTELHEAAQVDGAGRWHKLWGVTIPMLSPTILFNLVTGIIGASKVFAPAWAASGGGPHYASYFFVLHLFSEAFANLDFGYASALAWFLSLILVAFTLLQLRLARTRVYYGSETAEF